MASQRARSSSPAPSPARSTRPPCRPICRSRRRRSPRPRSARRRPARRSCTCTRATPRPASPTRRPRPSRRSCRVIKQRSDVRHQHHHRRRADMKIEERVPPGRDLQARGRLAQHGLDELRPLSTCSQRYKDFKYDWERPYLEATRDLVFRNTFKDIEYILADLRRATARASSSSATTSAISTTSRISPTAGWSSRRSSSSRCSASSAASARIPRTWRT